MGKIFKRKLYGDLLKWKKERNGETALLIEGARRTGKSTLAEEFAKREYKSYILIDFSSASAEVKELFDDISDLDYIFVRLQLIYGVQLKERDSLVIFDEVQLCPKARQAIKHLVKDHRYDYIETGSLISIRQNVKDILIPSEETRIRMYPMDFEEFLWANGEYMMPILKELYQKRKPLGDGAHRTMMRTFRLYMLVGGMPQAVDKYLATNDLSAVDRVKRDIISLYEEDMVKLDVTGKAKAMFDAIPGQLSKNGARYIASSVIDDDKRERIFHLVNLLAESMIVNIAYHSDDPNVGLALTRDVSRYKMFVADTGLFITLAFKDKSFAENKLYNKILSDKTSANLGYVYENMVAQILRTSGRELYYHVIPREDAKSFYEVDFLITDGHKVSPIEVKSSGYKTHKSMDMFCEKYSGRIQSKYLVYTKDYQWSGGVNYLPIYMLPLVE